LSRETDRTFLRSPQSLSSWYNLLYICGTLCQIEMQNSCHTSS